MEFAVLLLLATMSSLPLCRGQPAVGGQWRLVHRSIGISAMHMVVLPNNKMIAFDRTDFGLSNISLPSGRCRYNSHDEVATVDCTAHAVEVDLATGDVRPLMVQTDTWCSSGALAPDGTLVQTGGYNDGDRVVRYLYPCDTCDWEEVESGLQVRRWYATDHILPDGRVIVVGGEDQYNYEFVPKRGRKDRAVFDLPFLYNARDKYQSYLYPFVHLSPDGNMFIFANNKSILLDYVNNRVVRTFPDMPGGVARNYPSTGSSVLLPLELRPNNSHVAAEVMVCGGAAPNASWLIWNGTFELASRSCGRLVITDEFPSWVMMDMPLNRVMGDMVLLPTADVIIINGAARGSAGWNSAIYPVLHPVIYRTGLSGGEASVFQIMNPTMIPRMYHSTAHLAPDGRVLVGGSNPHKYYNFTGVLFPTDLSLEVFSPPYLFANSNAKPRITGIEPGWNVTYGQKLTIWFSMGLTDEGKVMVTLVSSAFVTHSFSMNQRLLVLDVEDVRHNSSWLYSVDVHAPANAVLAPPGYYMLFVVHDGVPSEGRWLHIK